MSSPADEDEDSSTGLLHAQMPSVVASMDVPMGNPSLPGQDEPSMAFSRKDLPEWKEPTVARTCGGGGGGVGRIEGVRLGWLDATRHGRAAGSKAAANPGATHLHGLLEAEQLADALRGRREERGRGTEERVSGAKESGDSAPN